MRRVSKRWAICSNSWICDGGGGEMEHIARAAAFLREADPESMDAQVRFTSGRDQMLQKASCLGYKTT